MDSESEIFRLRRDISRLANEMAALRAESAKPVRNTRKSGAALVSASALAVATAAFALACVAYFSIGTIRRSLVDAQARIATLQQISPQHGVTNPGPDDAPPSDEKPKK